MNRVTARIRTQKLVRASSRKFERVAVSRVKIGTADKIAGRSSTEEIVRGMLCAHRNSRLRRQDSAYMCLRRIHCAFEHMLRCQGIDIQI